MLKVAIAGVGNCASALVQGVYQARSRPLQGLMEPRIGRWTAADIEFVAAFDIDRRKVGQPLSQAIFAAPNCTRRFFEPSESGCRVMMGPLLDGFSEHMLSYPEERRFCPSSHEAVPVADVLRRSGAQVLVLFLPVGSEQAARHYAEECLAAGVALVNCIPVFIASDAEWAKRFRDAGLPLIGDDVKSQFGATILHRALARLMTDRGVELTRTYQLNTGGNTDFLNMLERERTESKRLSKTNSVTSQLDAPLDPENIHIGPSDYVAWQGDNKVAFLRLEGFGFGGAPVQLEMRLSVQDSPNSAGVVIDAIRCAGLALENGLGGPLNAASAFYMKSPPQQLRDLDAHRALQEFLAKMAPCCAPKPG